jgi:uncharacterized tellurite resistance protein B-like protein
MFNFLKKKITNKDTNNLFLKTAALLIHAAKIDENFEEKEKDIIKKTLIELGAKDLDINEMMIEAEIIEKKSNQILDFTREIKNEDDQYKIKIIETLWGIIYADNNADMYETNLMRRLSGLLYVDSKIMGDIKERIKTKLS